MSKWYEVEVKENGEVFFSGEISPMAAGEFRPTGLGKIQLRNTKKAGLHIVRFSSGGNFVYSHRLRPENKYRFGPRWAHRIKAVEEERDPIKKIFRLLDLPISLLRAPIGPELRVEEFHRDVDRFSHPASTNNFRTDGRREEYTDRVIKEYPGTHCSPDMESEYKIVGATWAIEEVRKKAMNGGSRVTVSEVWVWPNCTPINLFNALAPYSWRWTSGDPEVNRVIREEGEKWVAEICAREHTYKEVEEARRVTEKAVQTAIEENQNKIRKILQEILENEQEKQV